MKFTFATLVLVAGSIFAARIEAGQIASPQARPKRKLHANTNPVLSPTMTLAPGAPTTIAGQYLARPAPQPPQSSTDANQKPAPKLQKPAQPPLPQIKSGLGKTGHSARYMNYGGHYSLGSGAGSR